MLTDTTHTELLIEEKRSTGLKVLAVVCALAVTAIVFAGYTYLRKRTAEQRLAASATQPPSTAAVPKGPPKAHILVDDALLKGGQTIIGGTVRNISAEKLNGLMVALELRRRKDGSLEQTSVALEPGDLEPDQEGRYVSKASSAAIYFCPIGGSESRRGLHTAGLHHGVRPETPARENRAEGSHRTQTWGPWRRVPELTGQSGARSIGGPGVNELS